MEKTLDEILLDELLRKQGKQIIKYNLGRTTKKTKANKRTKKRRDTSYRYLLKQTFNCELCGDINKLCVHHIDKNKMNNNRDNLIVLCHKCHCEQHKDDYYYKIMITSFHNQSISNRKLNS